MISLWSELRWRLRSGRRQRGSAACRGRSGWIAPSNLRGHRARCLVCLRQSIGRALGWTLSLIDALASSIRRRVGSVLMTTGVIVLMIGLIGAVGALMTNLPQLTSEIARLWLIMGASWFFFLRGDPLAERLARSGSSLGSLLRYVSPLLGVVLVLVGIQVITHDMGPLLIVCYGAGAFVAASVAMWWNQRSGAYRAAFALAMALFVIWIFATTLALFELGALDDVTAGRLENLAAPLASANDQLALVTWFQRAAPPAGFGLGAVPWCGHAGGAGCAGVPAQIQSDYTLTALVGAFGWTAAGAIVIGWPIWLHRLIRHQRQRAGSDGACLSDAQRRCSTSPSRRAWQSCRCCSWCCSWSVWPGRSIRPAWRRATAIATSACAKSPR